MPGLGAVKERKEVLRGEAGGGSCGRSYRSVIPPMFMPSSPLTRISMCVCLARVVYGLSAALAPKLAMLRSATSSP
jgi:hypothetical protein